MSVKKQRDPRDTPAMRQYACFKKEHPESILFFRMGDFYEMFDKDAHTVHEELGLALTSRSGNIPMAGIPHHASENYIKQLIEKGYRIALCEQLEEASESKNIVKRGVVQVLTPGTLIDENLLKDDQPNILASYYEHEKESWISTIELTTGNFNIINCDKKTIKDVLARTGICELVVNEKNNFFESTNNISITKRPAWWFDSSESKMLLCEYFKIHNLSSLGLEKNPNLTVAPGALLRYVLETQSAHKELKFLKFPKLIDKSDHLIIDEVTLNNLEVLKGGKNQSQSTSLLSSIPKPLTPMGRRLIRSWLCEPLIKKQQIDDRLDAVDELLKVDELRNEICNLLKNIGDLPRILTRLVMKKSTPRDLISLGKSIKNRNPINTLLDKSKKITRVTNDFNAEHLKIDQLSLRLSNAFVDSPPAHLRSGGLIKEGYDNELDSLRNTQSKTAEWLIDYQKKISTETGIKNIKIGHNKIFGYYIEISHAKKIDTPSSFTRVQTLKNAERYTTPELASFHQKIISSSALSISREKEIIENLSQEILNCDHVIRSMCEIISILDCLISFAKYANDRNLTRPKIVNKNTLEIKNGRHPILDQTIQNFIPNDCSLLTKENKSSMALITGPNMAGKSTYLRQNALIILLAQTGCFVPAEKATIGITDRIFTRIGSGDDLHNDRSTFMVEMSESAIILNQATEKSFIIFDEIGRGTSTLDGLAIAWAFTESISKLKAKCLFATHYHELTELSFKDKNLCNLNVIVKESGEDVFFVHKIKPGSAKGSYGIHVAKIAGVPIETIERSKQILKNITVDTSIKKDANKQPLLFSNKNNNDSEIINKINSIDIDSLTPLKAFDKLRSLIDFISKNK